MVSYHAQRTPPIEGEEGRRYQLFKQPDRPLLLARRIDAPSATEPPQVRFSRANSARVATMDLPRPTDRRPDKKQRYAVIYEHAVYALITTMDLSGGTSPLFPRPPASNKFDRLVIEVEGHHWLGLCPAAGQDGPPLTLYDMVAADLPATVDVESADLPEPIGFIEAGEGEGDYDLTLPAGRLTQEGVVALALVYLVDNQY
ncbi:MAG: hypothetical protein LC131_12990 [Anaerolineae bacterium]|nr:hypothetical protein [Anaerolineae bacterium]